MKRSTQTIFDNYPDHIRPKMLAIKALIFEVASEDPRIGAIEETTKWGEPSYLTSGTKSGTTIRMDWKEATPDKYMLFFNCKTSLVSDFRSMFGEALEFQKNRAIILDTKEEIPKVILKECIRMALTYHL